MAPNRNSFRAAVSCLHLTPAIFELAAGEWRSPKLRSLLTATASGHASIDAYEMDLERLDHGTRRLVVSAQKLQYADADVPRLLMTVSEVTDACISERLKDELLRDKAVLLQEVQHRVANGLQIIASALIQSARGVLSEEARTHLTDAHNRVLSIATVQQQLARSHQGDVELRPYFTQLCQRLGASMIRDHEKQSIEVSGDSSKVKADVSISLGLIVNELVINALKHAFPGQRSGKFIVDCQSKGPNWTLSIGDAGVRMPANSPDAMPGLGTTIVEALARQLKARATVTPRKPGCYRACPDRGHWQSRYPACGRKGIGFIPLRAAGSRQSRQAGSMVDAICNFTIDWLKPERYFRPFLPSEHRRSRLRRATSKQRPRLPR